MIDELINQLKNAETQGRRTKDTAVPPTEETMDEEKRPNWTPKLGEKFHKGPSPREPLELQGLRDVGFDPTPRLMQVQTQIPGKTGDKNYEGNQPSNNEPHGASTPMNEQNNPAVQTSTTHAQSHGVPSGNMPSMPLSLSLSHETIRLMRGDASQVPFTQDLARFGAKALILVTLASAASIVVHIITKPATDL